MRKYGHRSDLNEVHLKAISTTIKLNFTEMKEHKESFYSLIYNDAKAFHRYGKYNVMNFIILKVSQHSSLNSVVLLNTPMHSGFPPGQDPNKIISMLTL